LEAFFRDAENFHSGMRIAAIIYAVGPFDSEDDWDRGNWVYEWRRGSIRVRVATSSAYVKQVELLSPASTSDVDEAVEVLWQYPAQVHFGDDDI